MLVSSSPFLHWHVHIMKHPLRRRFSQFPNCSVSLRNVYMKGFSMQLQSAKMPSEYCSNQNLCAFTLACSLYNRKIQFGRRQTRKTAIRQIITLNIRMWRVSRNVLEAAPAPTTADGELLSLPAAATWWCCVGVIVAVPWTLWLFTDAAVVFVVVAAIEFFVNLWLVHFSTWPHTLSSVKWLNF